MVKLNVVMQGSNTLILSPYLYKSQDSIHLQKRVLTISKSEKMKNFIELLKIQ